MKMVDYPMNNLRVARNTLRMARFVCLALVASALGAAPVLARDILTVTITQGVESAVPVAVARFVAPTGDPNAEAISRTLQEVISGDLNRSGRLSVVDRNTYPQQPGDFLSVDFPAWQGTDAQSLVIGKLEKTTGTDYSIEFRLVDIYGASQELGYRVPTSSAMARVTAHQIADLVYQKLTGEPGVFSTRIAYVAVERTADGGRIYRLNVADSDGADPQTLLESREPVLSPAWSPDGRKLAYTSLEGSRATLFLQDIRSGQRNAISSGEGMHSAPAFSPDGKQVALTISRDGNPDIYVYSMATQQMTRITRDAAIDTEPAFSPDGRTLAFTSDRGGAPQIYTVDLRSPQPRRLTFEMGGYNARPRYAPDGKSLAVVTQGTSGKGFRIGIIDLERGFMNVLSDGPLDESPTFAANGQMLMYTTRTGRGSELAVVSNDGRVKQRLRLSAAEVREPAWGPLPTR